MIELVLLRVLRVTSSEHVWPSDKCWTKHHIRYVVVPKYDVIAFKLATEYNTPCDWCIVKVESENVKVL
jgi:hypothetical protein